MDKIKITNHQLFSLTATCTVGGAILFVPSLVASIAKQDAWLSALLTPIFGMLVIWIYWYLGSQYPSTTFVGIIKGILGKWIGLFIAANFVFLCFIFACIIPWYISDFVTMYSMPATPSYAISLIFVIAVVISVIYGIETFARASELFLFFASMVFIFAMLLVLPNVQIENLQPVFEKGMLPILEGSVFLSCFTALPGIILMMIYPLNVKIILEAKNSLIKGTLCSSFLIFISILMSILVLGSRITSVSSAPTYILAKEINVGVIFSRLEFLIAAVWIVTEFMLGILTFYATVIGLSQLFGLKEHKRIVIPLGLIILIMSGVILPNNIYQADWVSFVWTPYIVTYGLILPVLLLLVFFIKNEYLK